MMIADFDDFCLWVYVIVDELWRRLRQDSDAGW